MASATQPNKKVFLQVLWSGVDTGIPTLFLFTDTNRYIFNCGEGLQRLIRERKIKLGKLDKFFFTRYQWSHIGGLPGFSMTLKDIKCDTSLRVKTKQTVDPGRKNVIDYNRNKGRRAVIEQQKNNQVYFDSVGNKQLQAMKTQANVCIDEMEKKNAGEDESNMYKINVYAPQGMKKIIAATKHFLCFENTGVKFEVNEHHWNDRFELKGYEDSEITLHSIPLYNNTEKPRPQPYSKQDDTIKRVDLSSRFHPPSLCYACHLNPVPGKLDVMNAKMLGVPKGPLFGMLKRGETVVLDNGKIVTPQEVLGPETPGPIFLIIDCPSVFYIESLIQNSNLSTYLSQDKGAHLVVHLSPEEVCQDNAYSEWAKRFPFFTKHIYLNKVLQETVAFQSQHCLQIMLNHIDSEFFPLTEEHKTMKKPKDFTGDSMKNFVKINLRELMNNPSNLIDSRDVKSIIDDAELLSRVHRALQIKKSSNKGVTGECSSIKDDARNINGKRHHKEDLDSTPNKKLYLDDAKLIAIDSKPDYPSQIYPKIICLGTGASIPSKYRNVSGTLVFLSENDAVLLDCGEGTYRELFRHYGDNVEEILLKIKFIFISHMHADHHLGLITLIIKLNALQKQPGNSVMIMAPNILFDWLTKYADASESLKFNFVSCKSTYQGFSVLENLHAQPVKVEHPGIAHGVVLVYNNVKITYSGDTMPCDALITAGRNSKLLIHEATLDDDKIDEARVMKHTTTSQAIEVAQRMNAEFLLLTHFSQRFSTIRALPKNYLASQTAFAFDHMEITLNNIPKFCELIPKLNALFAQEGI